MWRSLKRFTEQTKLRHWLMTLVAQRLSDDDIGGLRAMFAGMDKSCTGTVSLAELQQALQEIGLQTDDVDTQVSVTRVGCIHAVISGTGKHVCVCVIVSSWGLATAFQGCTLSSRGRDVEGF